MVFHEIVGRARKHNRIPRGRVAGVDIDANQRARRGRLDQRIVAAGSGRRRRVSCRVILDGMVVKLPASILFVSDGHVAYSYAERRCLGDPRGRFGGVAYPGAALSHAIIRRKRQIDARGNHQLVDEIGKIVIRVGSAAALGIGFPIVFVRP